MTDHFSKWSIAEAVTCKSAVEVASIKIRTTCTDGCFETLTTEGREFVKQLNDIICETLNIDHRIASAHHPQTRGLQVCIRRIHLNAFQYSSVNHIFETKFRVV